MSRAGVFGARATSVVRGQAPASTQAFHCSTVTSVRPIANGASTVTRCAGFSLGSLVLLPMVNVPGAITASTGQAGQSRISEPAFCSCDGPLAARGGSGAAGVAGVAVGAESVGRLATGGRGFS